MCGISIIINHHGINTNEILKMNQLISHRGPDDEGFYLADLKTKQAYHAYGNDTQNIIKDKLFNLKSLNNNSCHIALAHRRLSIIDLTIEGHQPMMSHDKHFVIVFNGEIYNYKLIRRELESKGVKFDSKTDTEVIVNAWSVWGEDCLSKLEGMFAFVIYDIRENQLFAIRDRFGIKPLYIFQDGKGLYIASEIKQFTAISTWKAEQNYQVVYDFLNWSLLDHTNETFFKNVSQVRSGEIIQIDLLNTKNNFHRKKWYHLKVNKYAKDYKHEVNEYNKLFINSVSSHLRADVPVGSCLSGGIDSSSIVGIINVLNENNGLQKTFSALSEEPLLNEYQWIDQVLKKYQVDAYFVTPTVELLKSELDNLTYYQDEPFVSTSPFAQWCVFKLANEQGIKVMLDGQGADEQLGGYAAYWGVLLAEKIKKGQLFQFFREYFFIKKYSGLSNYSLFQRIVNPFVNGRFSNLIRKNFTENHEMPSWLDLDNLQVDKRDPFLLLNARTPSFQKFSNLQIQSINLQSLLHYEDRNSMAHSIEARVPFLDHRLVEKSLSLPTQYKFKNGVSKRILRDSIKSYLPDRIYNRHDKIGFATAEENWMKSEYNDFFFEMIHQTIENPSSVVNKSALQLVNDIFSGKKEFSSLPWRIISYGNWLKCYNVN